MVSPASVPAISTGTAMGPNAARATTQISTRQKIRKSSATTARDDPVDSRPADASGLGDLSLRVLSGGLTDRGVSSGADVARLTIDAHEPVGERAHLLKQAAHSASPVQTTNTLASSATPKA